MCLPFRRTHLLLITVLRSTSNGDCRTPCPLWLLTNAFHLLSLISAHERISAYSMYPISMTQLIDLGSPLVRITRLISYVASKCQVYQHLHTTTLERSVITLITHRCAVLISNVNLSGHKGLSVSVYLTHNLIVFRFQWSLNAVYNQTPYHLCFTPKTYMLAIINSFFGCFKDVLPICCLALNNFTLRLTTRLIIQKVR